MLGSAIPAAVTRLGITQVSVHWSCEPLHRFSRNHANDFLRRFCEYPQELGFAFDDGVVMLSQIQILSHQFKIAKRIELYLGFGPDYLHAEFKRLGCARPCRVALNSCRAECFCGCYCRYMSLEGNERSEFKVCAC